MSHRKPVNDSPNFDFIDYFEGHRRASGWFADRFGNVKRHFSGDFFGTVKDDGILQLDETLIYNDGMLETRQWLVNVSDEGVLHAESESLVGPAVGQIHGNALRMRYLLMVQINAKTTWKLSMKDAMFLQPDGNLHNITQVMKFGFRIGTVSTQYFRPDDASSGKLANSRRTIDASAPPQESDAVAAKFSIAVNS